MPPPPIAIDLGELPRGEPVELETEVRWSGWWQRLRRNRTGSARWLAAAGTAALLLLTTGAAAAPARPWAVPHFTVPAGNRIAFGPEHLYVLDEPQAATPSITAYRLADGELLWKAHPQAPEGSGMFRFHQGTPLYVTYGVDQPETGGSYTPIESTQFDPVTGEPRWTREGFPHIGNDELVLLSRQEDPAGSRSELVAVDLTTGRELWSLPPAHGWGYDWGRPGHVDRLVSLRQAGDGWRLASYDLGTGARLATATVPLLDDTERMSVVGSHVFLQTMQPPRLRAYDLATLHQQWTAAVRTESWPLGRCGRWLCAYRDGVPHAVDPATGESAWSAEWLSADSPSGDGPPGFVRTGDYLLTRGWAIDTATGAPLVELTDWEPLSNEGWNSPASGLLTRRELSGASGVWHTWFGRLHTDLARVEVLGSVEGAQYDCRVAAAYLTCREVDDQHVWRIPGLARTDTVG